MGESETDKTEATQKAKRIMALLIDGEPALVWDEWSSEVFKSAMPRDAFAAHINGTREQLGDLKSSEFVSAQYMSGDPQLGFEGDLYVVVYLNTYNAGVLNERVVMVKDSDGVFRMGGIWQLPGEET